MFEIFSTREIATGIWISFFIAILFIFPSLRKSLLGIFKIVFSRQMLIPFILIIIYASFLILLIMKFSFWKNIYLKDIILWVIFIGAPICYNAIELDKRKHYFKNIIVNNLKLTVFLEFLISIFTFNLFIEIILLGTIFIISMMYAFSNTNNKYQDVRRFFGFLINFIMVLVIAFTIKNAVEKYYTVGTIDLIISFCIPIVFSILYLPLAYLFAVFAKYQSIFAIMSLKEPENKKIIHSHRLKIFNACKLSYKKINKFQNYIRKMFFDMSKDDFDKLIDEFENDLSNK